ncbi:hypothetical protein [Amycolatopsis sp. lyj-108]|uniref:hypothetical protein n=1 Tax=Amycolatopsis sp. lyj-108 TaxID=2789286 RepID=UPI00397A1999
MNEAKVMCDVLVSSGLDGNVGSWWHGRFVPVVGGYRPVVGANRALDWEFPR